MTLPTNNLIIKPVLHTFSARPRALRARRNATFLAAIQDETNHNREINEVLQRRIGVLVQELEMQQQYVQQLQTLLRNRVSATQREE